MAYAQTVNRRAGPRPPESKTRCVYVISRHNGEIKIGISRRPLRRLRALQASCHDRLLLIHHQRPDHGSAFDAEQKALMLLARYRLKGEWFDFDEWVAIAVVSALCEGRDADASKLVQLRGEYLQSRELHDAEAMFKAEDEMFALGYRNPIPAFNPDHPDFHPFQPERSRTAR